MRLFAEMSVGPRALAAIIGLGIALLGKATCATEIVVSDPFQYLDNRSANNINIVTGLRQTFGAVSVIPNGDPTNGFATTGIAQYSDGTQRTLNWSNDPTGPNFFQATIAANST